jgi:hypothetical protein
MVLEHHSHQWLEAFRSTTLFWKEATHLGFEVDARDRGWHLAFLGWYQLKRIKRLYQKVPSLDNHLACNTTRSKISP